MLCLAWLMACVTTGTCKADALDNWTWRNPVPIGFSPLTGVAYGNGVWVALADDGSVYVSSDTINWEDANTGPANFNSLAFVNGEFIVVGDYGTIATSSDGLNWQSQNSGTDRDLMGIAFGNGMFVAVGDFGTALTSLDGVNWTNSNSGTGEDLEGIAFGNGVFVAVGNDNVIVTSTDNSTSTTSPLGISWTIQNPANYPALLSKSLTKIAFGGGVFMAMDNSGNTVQVSPDGVQWILTNNPGLYPAPTNQWPDVPITGIAYGKGQFVTVSGSFSNESQVMPTTLTGSSGLLTGLAAVVSGTWTDSLELLPSGYESGLGVANAVTYGNGVYVAVGSDVSGKLGNVWISNDGYYWGSRLTGYPDQNGEEDPDPNPTAFQDLNAAAYGDNTFVVVGDGGEIATSSWTPVTGLDGITWEERVPGTNAYDLTGVAYGNGLWVTVGPGAILTSTDAVAWAQTSGSTAAFQSIAFGNNTFVAVGSSGIGASANGATWTPGTITSVGSTTASLTSVTYGNGAFVGIGTCSTTVLVTTSTTIVSGTTKTTMPVTTSVTTTTEAALVSTNGTFWTEHPIQAANGSLLSVAFNNGTYVTTGSSGAIFESPDGVNWLQDRAVTPNNLNGVAGSNGEFVAAGDNGTLLTSTDGVVWSARATTNARPQDLNAVAFGYGTFLVVGAKGTILQSQTLDGVGPTAATGVGTSAGAGVIVLTGTVNPNGKQTNVAFEYSTDQNALKWDGSLYYSIVEAWGGGATATTLPTIVPAGFGPVVVSTTVSGLGSEEYYFRVEASNTDGESQGEIVMANPITPVITSAPTTLGVEGAPFTFQIAADNVPTSYAATGLPAGLNVDPSSGVISGTPTVTGTFAANLTATNGGGTGPGTLQIAIVLPNASEITSALYVSANEGLPFSYSILGTNYPDSFSAANLPAGLSIDTTTGIVSGTAAVFGNFAATITASNAGGGDQETLNFTILPLQPAITSAPTITGTSGQPLQYQIQANGNANIYGATGLPPGLVLDTQTGLISGTPTVGGTYGATLQAGNGGGEGTATLNFLIDTTLDTLAGHYQGLGVGGSLILATLDTKGDFTGKITAGGATYDIKGKLNQYGTYSNTIKVGGAYLEITLAAETPAALTGSVTVDLDGTSTTYYLSASQVGAFTASTLPPGLEGYYTAILLSSSNAAEEGASSAPGFGTMTVSPAGAIRLTGRLGDGTPFTAQSHLNADGITWPLFVKLYPGGHPGLIEGTMTFNQNSESDCAGTLYWTKPTQTSGKYYQAGFTTTTALEAARYVAPPLASGTGVITIGGGDLNPSAVTDNLTIATDGKATPVNKEVTLSIDTGKGAFTGDFTDPDTNEKTPYWGVIYQKAPAEGFGLFLGTDQAGSVDISQ